MRLTVRIILSMMNSLETALDEICNKYRDNAVYYAKFTAVRKSQKNTRSELARVLDDMIDTGEGN